VNYEQALEYIHGTHKFGIKLGLDNIRKLLEFMDNPHRKLKYVHVAGTNGKGSTVAFISSILKESATKLVYTPRRTLNVLPKELKSTMMKFQRRLARITEYVKGKVELMISQGENHLRNLK